MDPIAPAAAPRPTVPDARSPDARSPDARSPDARSPDARSPDARSADARRPVPRPARAVGPALAALAFALAGGPASAQTVDVSDGEGGRVSIRASGADAADVAAALGERTGIPVVVTGDASTRIDIDIVDEPLEKAVAQLAPNHLVMRGGRGADSPITEIVLMMPDGDDGGVESTEFLPTGEPADGVVSEDPALADQGGGVDENGQPLDATLDVLRDPDRAAAVRAAAASAVAAQAAAQAAELAAGGLQDGAIDESTGLPLVDGQFPDDGSGSFDQVDPATLPQLEGSGLLNR